MAWQKKTEGGRISNKEERKLIWLEHMFTWSSSFLVNICSTPTTFSCHTRNFSSNEIGLLHLVSRMQWDQYDELNTHFCLESHANSIGMQYTLVHLYVDFLFLFDVALDVFRLRFTLSRIVLQPPMQLLLSFPGSFVYSIIRAVGRILSCETDELPQYPIQMK